MKFKFVGDESKVKMQFQNLNWDKLRNKCTYADGDS